MLTPISKATDFLCISGAAYISQCIVFPDNNAFSYIDGLLGMLGLALSFITFRVTRVYRPFRYDPAINSLMRALAAWLISQLVLAVISHAYPGSELRSRWLIWWTATAACALVIGRYLIHALPSLVRWWRLAPTRVAIVAPSSANDDLLARIAPQVRNAFIPEVIYDPALLLDTAIGAIPAVRTLEKLKEIMRAEKLKEIWIVNSLFQPISVEHLFEAFREEFVNIRVLPILEADGPAASVVADFRGIPILNVMATPERNWETLPKEIFDRVFAFFVVIAISPILLAIAVAVKFSSPGPVLFRQRRKGMNGDVFAIYKFRTMYQGADQPGSVAQARKGDARITKVGRFLRRTSLDELPQFLNVLKGEMSVVGPRPHAVEHDEYYKTVVQHYMFRYRIKPGITGLAQVSGYRGETAQIEKMAGRVKLDIHYIQHWTFLLDLKIIGMTVLKGFAGSNAY